MSDSARIRKSNESELKKDCLNFDFFTDGCDLWGSRKRIYCANYLRI
ncbi:MAG: hypothetical protein ACW967_10835 [Candidatus Hodarchaeales archaeon]